MQKVPISPLMSFEHLSHPNCKDCSHRFNNLFCAASNDCVDEVNAEKICTPYKKGEIVFKKGSRPFGVYCLNRGKVKLVKTGDDGKEQIVRLIKPGDPFGYRSLLSNDLYQASAVCLEDSGVCFIPKDLFLSVLTKDGNLSMEMMHLLSNDLRKAEIQLTHLAQKSVRERTAESILLLAETYGYLNNTETIDVQLTREELASYVGTATETVIRILADFKKEGVIEIDGRQIEIKDKKKLFDISNIHD